MNVAQLDGRQNAAPDAAPLRPSVWVALVLVTLSVYLPYVWLPFSSLITTMNDVQSILGLLFAPGIIPNVLVFKGLFDRVTHDAMGLNALFVVLQLGLFTWLGSHRRWMLVVACVIAIGLSSFGAITLYWGLQW